MRVKRAKLVRKYLRFFKIVYGIQPPYNVILDGNFIFTAIKLKLDIRDRVGKLLQGEEVKYFITQSILDELQSIGSKGKESHDFACKFCEVVNDRHFAGVDGTERLRSLLNESCEVLNLLLDDPLALIFNLGSDSSKKGKKMYFVASQDKDLRTSIGTIAGVPIIYLNAVTFVLEPPSASSRAQNVQACTDNYVFTSDLFTSPRTRLKLPRFL